MKVSILCSNLSSNCLGRSYILAKLLKKNGFAVEIVGPLWGKEIWKPLANDPEINYKYVKFFKPIGSNFLNWVRLYRKISGDTIYVNKPLFNSLFLGVIRKIFNKKRLILDIDDWEMGFFVYHFQEKKFFEKVSFFLSSIIMPFRPDNFLNIFLGNCLIKFSDKITVANSFLEKKYSGKIIVHARDINKFDPSKFDKKSLKKNYDFTTNSKIVTFFGTPSEYKGIEDLIESFKFLNKKNVILLLVGVINKGYSLKIKNLIEKKINKKNFRVWGQRPFYKVPEILTLSDIVVIPQRNTLATKGQLPVKIFDAMAMAKPIIATRVSDLPKILSGGCGFLIDPGNAKELAEKINYVLANTKEALRKGERARAKCIKEYSLDSVGKKLVAAVNA